MPNTNSNSSQTHSYTEVTVNKLYDVVIKKGNSHAGIYVVAPNESTAIKIAEKMGRRIVRCYEMNSDFADNPESL